MMPSSPILKIRKNIQKEILLNRNEIRIYIHLLFIYNALYTETIEDRYLIIINEIHMQQSTGGNVQDR